MEKVFEYAIKHLEGQIKHKEMMLRSGRKVPEKSVPGWEKSIKDLKIELLRVEKLQREQNNNEVAPTPKKQTAANNEFLKEVKTKYNAPIFKKISTILNEQGEESAKKALERIKHII